MAAKKPAKKTTPKATAAKKSAAKNAGLDGGNPTTLKIPAGAITGGPGTTLKVGSTLGVKTIGVKKNPEGGITLTLTFKK